MTDLERAAALIDTFHDLPRSPALLMVFLADGKTKTKDHLQARFEDVFGYRRTDTHLMASAKRLRAKIAGAGFQVVTVHRVGYRLVTPVGWQAPWC